MYTRVKDRIRVRFRVMVRVRVRVWVRVRVRVMVRVRLGLGLGFRFIKISCIQVVFTNKHVHEKLYSSLQLGLFAFILMIIIPSC